MSRDLKKRGFTFVGSTICYAFMQATGMVNDHLAECFRYELVTIATDDGTTARGPRTGKLDHRTVVPSVA